MARARNIKPGFFKNEILGEMDTSTRLLFIGLWTLADREGRLEDRPRRVKMELFPYDSFDVDPMLDELQSGGFLVRYVINGNRYIQLVNFVKHQDPHYREKASEIPPPEGHSNLITATNVTRTQRAKILERDSYTCQQCGSQDQLCIDHVIPVSRGGDSSDDNLQVLCLSCNTKKSNKIDSSSSQHQVDVSASKSLDATLNPDSLIPSSLIPDSPLPIPESRASGAYTPEFEQAWDAYPERPGASKADAFKAWNARLKAKHTTGQMIQGAMRYAAYCEAAQTEPQFIKQPATFFGPGLHFQADWTYRDPPKKASGWVQEARLDVAKQIFGERGNGTNGQVIDITPTRAGEGDRARLPETLACVRESATGEVAGA